MITEQKDRIIIDGYWYDADSLRRDVSEVYDYINELLGMLPEDVEISPRKLRNVQCVLEYLMRGCDIVDVSRHRR